MRYNLVEPYGGVTPSVQDSSIIRIEWWLFIVILIGVIVAIVILIVVIYCCCLYKKTKSSSNWIYRHSPTRKYKEIFMVDANRSFQMKTMKERSNKDIISASTVFDDLDVDDSRTVYTSLSNKVAV